MRVFKVTGTETAPTTASKMRATSISSCSSAEPASRLQTFFAGQPILISMISAPASTLRCAASAIMFGIEAGDLNYPRARLARVIHAPARFRRVP